MQSTPYATPTSSRCPPKARGTCGVCFLEWKLHHNNGLVHKHGHRHTSCMGSHKPPIETPNDDLHPLPSSFTTNAKHPSLQSKLLCHIPKGTRNCTGHLLTNIINRLLSDPMRPEHWRCLFCFAALTLAKPQHGWKMPQLDFHSEEKINGVHGHMEH